MTCVQCGNEGDHMAVARNIIKRTVSCDFPLSMTDLIHLYVEDKLHWNQEENLLKVGYLSLHSPAAMDNLLIAKTETCYSVISIVSAAHSFGEFQFLRFIHTSNMLGGSYGPHLFPYSWWMSVTVCHDTITLCDMLKRQFLNHFPDSFFYVWSVLICFIPIALWIYHQLHFDLPI